MPDLFSDYSDEEVKRDVVTSSEVPFVQVPLPIIRLYGKELGACGVAVYAAIKSYANYRSQTCFLLIKTIAEQLDMGESTVRREIAKLVELGLISKVTTGRSLIFHVETLQYIGPDRVLSTSGQSAISERSIYKEKYFKDKSLTTSNPDAGTETPPKKRRRTKEQIFSPYSGEVKDVVNTLGGIWPKVRRGSKTKITSDLALFASRVQDVLASNKSITSEILIGAGRRYLAEDKEFPHAPEFFFGPGKNGDGPPWLPYARMEYHEQHKQLTLAVAAGATQ